MQYEVKMNRKLIAWTLLGATAAVCTAVFMLMRHLPVSGATAHIYSDGELIRTVPLSESCEFTIETGRGFNTIQVADGSIAVISADCPDKVCVHSGAVSSGAVPIICLPHRLEIRVVSAKADFDAQIN